MKNNKTRSWFFEEIDKTGTLLGILTKKQRRDRLLVSERKEHRIKRILKAYSVQPYGKKVGNSDVMDQMKI